MDVEEHPLDISQAERPLSPRPRPPPFDLENLTGHTIHTNQTRVSSETDYQYPAPHPPSHLDAQPASKSRVHTKRTSASARPTLPMNMLPSAPASPPTPAPSPTPFQRAPTWNSAGENEDAFLRDARGQFLGMNSAERQRLLAELLNMCDSHLLSFVSQFVSPRLKKDPFEHLPDELCLRV
jgi:hypothetical protein